MWLGCAEGLASASAMRVPCPRPALVMADLAMVAGLSRWQHVAAYGFFGVQGDGLGDFGDAAGVSL